MRRRNAFIPTVGNRLEVRLVLSHSGPARGFSVVVSGLHPHQQVLSAHQQSIVAEVNQAFDSFTSDYDQARATYFAAIQNTPTSSGTTSPSAATTSMAAFKDYTRNRVSLLSQEVLSSFLQSPQANGRAHGKDNTLKQLITAKLIGPQNQAATGSLADELVTAIPQPSSSAATGSLFALAQDNAIETARVAVINGINILRNADFGNVTPQTHNN